MRILLVHNYFQFRGGTDDYVDILYKLLIKNGHEVYLYSKRSEKLSNFFTQAQSGINLITSSNNELRKIISEFRPEICHIHNIFPQINFSVVKECNRSGVGIVQTVHDYRYLCINGAFF